MTRGKGNKQKHEQRLKDKKNGASDSQAQAVAVEDQAQDQLMIDQCCEAQREFHNAIDQENRESMRSMMEVAQKKLSNLAERYRSPVPCFILSKVLVSSCKIVKSKEEEEKLLRQALGWAERANEIWANNTRKEADNTREEGSHMSLLAQHADVLTKLAKVLDIGARDKEQYLNKAVAHSKKALDHVRGITLPSSHPIFKDILGNVMSSMSMLSEFKVQEDGLRSFNLKPNLDEIKEEEVWSEDEVWAGEEEVCEEDDDEVWMRVQKSLSLSLSLSESSSHPPPPTTIEFDISKTNEEGWRKVEESLSLSESPLDAAPPPPPQIEIGNWKTASIKYKKTTKWRWDGYSHGWTSFGEELEEHRSTPITLVEFKNLLEANDYFDKLKNFKGDRIVECHIISGDEVMIESVDSDIETWVEEEYKSFSSEGGGGMMEWWDHIKVRFKTIFRDILRALQFLFERSAYCGNLANRISIINQKTAKICDFRVEGDVEKEIWQDIDELWHLMVTVLLRCCLKKDLNAAECDDILKEGRVPLALRRFLLNLHNRDVQKKWDVLWLLDESFFWEDIEKHRLIRKLNGETVLFLSDDGFRSAMETLLGESNLVSYVTSFLSSTDPQYARRPEFKVLSHGLRLQQAHKRKLEDLGIFGYKPPYENNIFHAVVAYSKNLVFHHKHHSRLHLSTCQLASLADGLFHGGCSMIRNAIAIAIGMDSSKRTWRDVSHLLSKEDL